MVICPRCGHLYDVDNPMKVHQCTRCQLKFYPIKKNDEIEKDTILTCRSYNDFSRH